MSIRKKSSKNFRSRLTNETLEEKAHNIVSKLKSNINELGGMEDEHPVFGRLNASKMSKKEMNDLMRKHYGKENYFGDEDEDSEWEEIDIKGMDDMDDDEFDMEDDGLGIPDDMPSYKTKYRYSDEDDMDEEDMDYDEEQESELDEGFDSIEMKNFRKREDYNPKEFKKLPLGKGEIGFDEEQLDDNSGVDMKRRFFNDIKREMRRKRDFDDEYGDEEFAEGKGETCEQCGGGMMKEGECSECGYKMEGIYDVDDIDNEENEFDYVEEEMNEEMDFEEDRVEKFCNTDSPDYDAQACEYHKKQFGSDSGEMTEKLHGGQRKLDKNKNGRLDAADFKMLRAMKGKKETDEEVEEGNAFTGALAKAKKAGRDEFEVGGKKFNVTEVKTKTCKVCGMKNCKCKHKKDVKESVRLTESQMIDLIESVILEQKEKLKSTGKPRGLQKYQQSHEKSGKENKDYLNSVGKKMKDYMKDGSKGDFEMNPKKFPMGNGELGEMKKKAYKISDDGKDFLNSYQRPGMENLDYDEIHPNEDWMKDTIEGSSRTGNNPKWANAVETDVNKNINKKRKENKYAKAKRAAFQKSPQPIINDKTGVS